MIRYVRRPPTIEATQILDAVQAAQLLGGTAVAAEADRWAVEVQDGPLVLTYAGRIGDYLTPGPWRVVGRADFEAEWQPADVDLSGGLNV